MTSVRGEKRTFRFGLSLNLSTSLPLDGVPVNRLPFAFLLDGKFHLDVDRRVLFILRHHQSV